MSTLGELVKITGGGTPSRKEPSYWGGPIAWATVKDFSGRLLDGALESITEEGIKNSATNLIPAGSIIVPTRMAVGKVAISTVNLAINQDLKALSINDTNKVNRDYLFHFLLSKSEYLNSRGKGATVKGITLDVLNELDVPLPPLEEQKRIAAILDKADTIRRKRQQAIELTDQFLRSVFLDMFGDPVTNPKGWEMEDLKSIAKIQIGPFGTQLHKNDYVEGGIPLINPSHIIDGKIAPKYNLSISANKHASLPEYHLQVDDIIMGRRGEMGRCAIISPKEEGWMCGTGSLIIRPLEKGAFAEYLNTLLTSAAIKRHLENESIGATLPNLNKSIVGAIKVPVPSTKALKKYDALKEKFASIKEQLNNAASKELFEPLSQSAFKGELTQNKAA